MDNACIQSSHIGRVTLRNEYVVYKATNLPDTYIVKKYSKHQVFESYVPASNVKTLYNALRGRLISINDVCDEFSKGLLQGLKLQSFRDWKQRYEIQDILVVMCALGLATAEKQGKGFVYWIKSDNVVL